MGKIKVKGILITGYDLPLAKTTIVEIGGAHDTGAATFYDATKTHFGISQGFDAYDVTFDIFGKGFKYPFGSEVPLSGTVKKVDVSVDGGRNWRPARLENPVLDKCITRFNLDWVWDGKPALVQSRATDETGYVQPTFRQLRAVRGTRSIYHNNAIQTWLVQDSGEVKNVQLS